MSRTLDWDGCVNVRDLGGLPTADGALTRAGAVVRGDNVRRLTDAGWESLVAHGVRRIVDLRWPQELEQDPPRELPIEAVHISLFGNMDADYGAELDRRLERFPEMADRIREAYIDFLEHYRANVGRAVAAVADAPEGGVLIHCAAGKDRTGIVAALLLRLVGVGIDDVADDYAESQQNLARLSDLYYADMPEEERGTLFPTPRASMLGTLEALEAGYGGAEEYLRGAGVTDEQLERVRARLRA